MEPPEPRRKPGILGAGLITGACNNDPSSVGTYSQVGAQFGYRLAWTLLFSYPLLVAIQQISARIGYVTACGIAGNLRRHYAPAIAYALVGLLAVANVANLAADLGAMGAVLKLVFDAPAPVYVCLLGLAAMLLGVLSARRARILRWLCLCLLSYVLSAFVVHVAWKDLSRALIWPALSAHPQYLMAVVAVLGTTISPYLFFWQAQQEAEAHSVLRLPLPPLTQASAEFVRIRLDTLAGMALSTLVALFIVITTASTLHLPGGAVIQTPAQAAEALRGVAGRFTFLVFALGIIGAGLLALPALAASAAYALSELLPERVKDRPRAARSRALYAAIVAATLIGAALNFTPITPMGALYASAVLNGVIALPLMISIMHLATCRPLNASLQLPTALVVLGWGAALVLGASVAAMALAWLVWSVPRQLAGIAAVP
jgi:Mn2+/Fe2+ NRAMP family transporter